MTECLKDKV